MLRLGRTGKQFLRYYILFFLCLVVLFIPLYQINLSMVSRTYLDASAGLLETGLANFESDLGHIEAIAQAAYSSPQFRRLSSLQGELDITDYYYTISLAENFKRYFISAGMLVDCGILYDSNMILTAKRLYFPGEGFYGTYFAQAGFSTKAQWLENLPRSYSSSGFAPLSRFTTLEGSYEGILFYIDFSNSPEKRSLFFATLEKNYILSRLATGEALGLGRILTRDAGGKVLIDSGAGAEGSAGITLEMRGRKRGIQARVDIPRRVFQERLGPFRQLAFTFALAYLALGIVLSLVFAQKSAKPVREILEDALSFGGGAGPGESPADFQNDYQYIQHFLAKAEKDLETFNARLAQQESLQRENLFERLLYGLVYSSAGFEAVKDYFPDFPRVFRIAALIPPVMEDAALPAYTMRQAMIQDIIEPHIPAKGWVHFSGNTLVLLLPEEAPEVLLRRLRGVLGDLRDKLNISCGSALSEPVRELRDMHQAFYALRQLLRLPRKEGEAEITLREQRGMLSFPLELLDASRLYEFLLYGEEDKAVDFINTMFYELCRRGYAGEDDIQQIFFLYRRVLLQVAGDLELAVPKEAIIPAYDSALELSFLFARVAEAARNICRLVSARRDRKNNDFERSVIEYIDGNITNPGLYTKMVTGFFHISENRLQRVVRKWTGKSFLEYTESKRMGLSRELLLKTDFSIARITQECGYSSENSFYKAFRRFYGVSPSEVRRN